jgi:hypothetical protein
MALMNMLLCWTSLDRCGVADVRGDALPLANMPLEQIREFLMVGAALVLLRLVMKILKLQLVLSEEMKSKSFVIAWKTWG